jgi:hypothetical protein
MLRRLLFGAFLLFPATLIAGEVRVDVDRHKDFSRYRTFSVEVGRLVRADGVVDEHNTLAEDRLRRAVAHELLARGIESADANAHLIVRVSGAEAERSEIMTTGWNDYPYWHRRWGYWRSPYYYGRWARPYNTTVFSRRYLEGLLTIDVVDRATGGLVYRARVTDEIGKDLDKHVAKAVDKAFKKFPVKEFSD